MGFLFAGLDVNHSSALFRSFFVLEDNKRQRYNKRKPILRHCPIDLGHDLCVDIRLDGQGIRWCLSQISDSSQLAGVMLLNMAVKVSTGKGSSMALVFTLTTSWSIL